MDEPECFGCRDAHNKITKPEARVAELTRKFEEATHTSKQQAAPSRKGPSEPTPRQSSLTTSLVALPRDSVTECHQNPLPEARPRCNDPLVEMGTAEQFQAEIPTHLIRKFTVDLGRCADCSATCQCVKPMSETNQRAKNFMKVRISAIPAIILGLISLSLPACERMHAEEKGEHEEHQKIVATSPQAKDVIITQQYVCQIRSQRHIEVCALQDGYLEEILVKEGQAVKQGNVMFRILPILYKARRDAELAEANQAQIEYEQSKQLAAKNVVSQIDVALAKAKLDKANAKANLAAAELDFTEVKAPFDGIVDRQNKQLGSLIEKKDVLTTLSDNGLMWVYFNVPEARYLEYKSHQGRGKENSQQLELLDSQIELVLANGHKFPYSPGNTVTVEGKFNNETGNIAFRADFPNPDRLLRHGQTGTVLIHQSKKNAVVIPQRATFEILDKQYVWVVGEDHVVHQRPITIEHELEDIFVIKSGLDLKDKIILEGVQQVHDGEKVEYEFKKPGETLVHQKYHAE